MKFRQILRTVSISLLVCALVLTGSPASNFPYFGVNNGWTQQERTTVHKVRSCDIQKMLNKAGVEEDSAEGQSLTALYRTLLGITDELNNYAESFRADNNDYINLFPLAYYHVTNEELKELRNGSFKRPKEKMEQMILFYKAYKFNRDNWDNKDNKDSPPPPVETHWKKHFEAAKREKSSWVNYPWDDEDVLNTAIEAHVESDLPRALRKSFEGLTRQQLDGSLGLELLEDFSKTENTLKEAFSKVQAELNYNGVTNALDSVAEQFIRILPRFEGALIRSSQTALKKVVKLRNEAWVKARGKEQLLPQLPTSDYSKYEEKASEKYCQKVPIDERNGAMKSGRNFGDPHLITFDGYRYSFQLAGEFTLAKSDDSLFDVQVRQLPIDSALSVDSAVAMQMGQDRVALYASDFPNGNTDDLIWVNGSPIEIGEGFDLSDGGAIYQKGNAYVFEWPTGEELVAQLNTGRDVPFINITVYVFDSQSNHISGLLGDANGNSSDDLRFRSGSLLPSGSTYRDTNTRIKAYGADWRISQSESLFDYQPGQSTQTFTVLEFPSEYLAVEQLPSQTANNARSVCLAQNVDPDLLESCVFDVAFSGDDEFAQAASRMSETAAILNEFRPTALEELDLSSDITSSSEYLNGTWEGTYTCSQGLTGLRLDMNAESNDSITAVFSFYADPRNPSVPTGSFNMSGSYLGASSGERQSILNLAGTTWIQQPSSYKIIDLTGNVFAAENKISGQILNSLCSDFELVKIR